STRIPSLRSIARSTAAVTGPRGSQAVNANLEAFRILIASRLPTRIWFVSNAVSVPGRAQAAQYRTPSDPCSSSSAIGVTTLPFDFDIFLRSGSSTQPEMAAFVQGSEL